MICEKERILKRKKEKQLRIQKPNSFFSFFFLFAILSLPPLDPLMISPNTPSQSAFFFYILPLPFFFSPGTPSIFFPIPSRSHTIPIPSYTSRHFHPASNSFHIRKRTSDFPRKTGLAANPVCLQSRRPCQLPIQHRELSSPGYVFRCTVCNFTRTHSSRRRRFRLSQRHSLAANTWLSQMPCHCPLLFSFSIVFLNYFLPSFFHLFIFFFMQLFSFQERRGSR